MTIACLLDNPVTAALARRKSERVLFLKKGTKKLLSVEART